MESELDRRDFEAGVAKGKAEAYADVLIRILTFRLGRVDPALRERIQAVSDPELLEVWQIEAVYAADADTARRLLEKIRRVIQP